MPNTQVSTTPAVQLDSAIEALKSLLGTRASTAMVQREHHSHSESYHTPALPDVVCYPHTTEEVSEIVKISAKYQIPVIAFGGGTSLEGHVNAIHGGISVDLREMNKVLRVSPEDLDVTVEAGVTRQQLNKALNNTGLTFFVDPGGESTLGGMAATRASGTTTVRYGTMRDNVLALTVVLADGGIIKTGTRARKSASGYDLTRLFVGSEGTLGIITELTLRLHPLPEAVSAAVCSFPSINDAVQTVIETIQIGASVARIELLDEAQMDAINRYSKTDYPVTPALFFEFHGASERQLNEQAEFVKSLAEEHGAKGFQWFTRLEDRDKLWEARHAAFYAALALRPGSKGLTTDACVPISRLAECILETQEDNRKASFPATLVGHVGDGNFHVVYAIDPANDAEMAEVKELARRIAMRALAMGGTCTGEHGIGIGKIKYAEIEHGPAMETMRIIKRALDPDNRMNPGKMLEV